ncbi:MerR family transcriptional regulator [Paenibacillus arenilitoris]|uniref:MerR family transcriptional regulator n=1 Tax=Paenibacillus arenilitoris TaxID=2772299 RepID=A0A927CQU6_9BACL|nr:MerR family transcriptional regulator [Paenibacillus arenilitoris]MBD2870251.1 MerR family transcriptional regulator [Paenibacillus arenilitoris]
MVIRKQGWKIGELAASTGLTVRALHHYDQKGLLRPSAHTEAGHRLYSERDIAKLQQIVSLKQLGFALDEIKRFMESPRFDPEEVIRLQLEKLNEHIRLQEELRGRLLHLQQLLKENHNVTTEQFIKTIEVITMSAENYFTPEQLKAIENIQSRISPERQRQYEQDWTRLLAGLQSKLDEGVPAGDPEVAALARSWKEIFDVFGGGDAGIVASAERFHTDHPGSSLQFGLNAELYRYIHEALSP